MDLRQTKQWGQYLSQIRWDIEHIGNTQILVRKVPFLKYSLIKIQHPKNPLPFKEIDQIAKKHHALFTLIEPDFSGFQESIFKKNGYQKSILSLTHTATTQINLQKKEEEIFASFSENAKRNIKKSEKNNLKIQKVVFKNNPIDKEFEKFFKLLSTLTKLKGFYAPGFNELYKKMSVFKKNSILLFTYYKEKPMAVVWVSWDSQRMSYMHTGITPEGYKLLANYLLVWEALKEAKKLGLKVFDFEGIYDPRFPNLRKKWKGLSEFKKRFHGDLIEYPFPQIKCHNRLFQLFYICGKCLSK